MMALASASAYHGKIHGHYHMSCQHCTSLGWRNLLSSWSKL